MSSPRFLDQTVNGTWAPSSRDPADFVAAGWDTPAVRTQYGLQPLVYKDRDEASAECPTPCSRSRAPGTPSLQAASRCYRTTGRSVSAPDPVRCAAGIFCCFAPSLAGFEAILADRARRIGMAFVADVSTVADAATVDVATRPSALVAIARAAVIVVSAAGVGLTAAARTRVGASTGGTRIDLTPARRAGVLIATGTRVDIAAARTRVLPATGAAAVGRGAPIGPTG